jgi:exodeoxyribonuclease-5
MDLLPAKDLIINRAFNYTKGQLEALDRVVTWSKNSDYSPFTLSGFAGTGKTTISKDIVRNISGKVACTAPTHKAARISATAIGTESCTIHSLLGLRPNIDLINFDANNPQFDILAAANIRNYSHILVDECSMINKGLFNLLIKESIRYKVKLLFIGDPYQLPPVGENYSLTFSVNNIYNLTEIVRQEEDNPIIQLLVMARDDVKNRSHKLVEFVSKRNSRYNSTTDSGYIIANPVHFSELIHDKFTSSDFEKNIDFCRYLSFTNDSVSDVNNYIRRLLFGEAKESVIKDDLFTSYSTIFNEFNTVILANSEDYIIDSIMNYNNQYLLSGYMVTLRKINGGEVTPNLCIIEDNIPENINRYKLLITELLAKTKSNSSITRSKAWEKFYEFKNYNLLLNDIIADNKVLAKKSLDYGFGLTVHKSQGSTFENAFINIKDIVYNKNGIPYHDTNLRNRLLYVALSRARNNLYLLI